MSHFVVGVILPKRKRTYDRKAVNTAVESLMAPFDENEVVEAYEESCYCVGKGASKEWLALNPPEVVKARVAALLLGAGFNPETFDYYASTDKETRKKFDAIHDDIEAERKRFIAAHPDGQAADPECEECNGTGDRETTYNPDSKWDWWTVGGRWTGMLDKTYDPRTDPRNIERCDLCGGTGTRRDNVACANPEQMKHCNGCNGCDGKGKRVKWSFAEDAPGNFGPIKDFLKTRTADDDFFALVTPEGEWLESGSMGWFGVSTGHDRDWDKVQTSTLEKYKDHVIAVVDCHV